MYLHAESLEMVYELCDAGGGVLSTSEDHSHVIGVRRITKQKELAICFVISSSHPKVRRSFENARVCGGGRSPGLEHSCDVENKE